MEEVFNEALNLVVDMYGCPNRCLHCWLGHMPNRKMKDEDDLFIINYFKPYFKNITYYSWVREPDYCENYRQRWIRDNEISIGIPPKRFELASFYRIVRDKEYIKFLKEVGTEVVQLTFFGLERLTDKYIGRKGAYLELLNATNILLDYGIAPRWQVFINEENKDEIVSLLKLSENLELDKRCKAIGKEFKFFVHSGSCDGENYKLYPIRLTRNSVPQEIIPYFLNYDKNFTEEELFYSLQQDNSYIQLNYKENIVLNISNNFDVYFNFSHMKEDWLIGNLLRNTPKELLYRIKEKKVKALEVAKEITIGELVLKYGDKHSKRLFEVEDYKEYLLIKHLESIK